MTKHLGIKEHREKKDAFKLNINMPKRLNEKGVIIKILTKLSGDQNG